MHHTHDNDPTSSGEESDGLSGGDNGGGGGGNVDKKRRRLELNRKVLFWCGRVDVRGVFSPFFSVRSLATAVLVVCLHFTVEVIYDSMTELIMPLFLLGPSP